MEEKKMNMKYYMGILCAVALVIGAMAGVSISAADYVDVNEITETVSMENVIESMEAKGFDVIVDGDQISAYKEYKKEGYEKVVQITIDCSDGECQFQKPQSPEGMNKKHFKFRMHGIADMEDVKEKMLNMGYDMEFIETKMAGMAHKGFEGCPMRAMMEQDADE
jgi:hypothetical protein